MLLILTNSDDATSDYVVDCLSKKGVNYLRLNTDCFVDGGSIGINEEGANVQLDGATLNSKGITCIWNRRPEMLKAREFAFESPEGRYALAEWTAALEGFLATIPHKKWINHPSANANAGLKVNQLASARAFNLKIPKTIVTMSPSEARDFYEACNGRIVAKPLSDGRIVREPPLQDSLIYTNDVGVAQVDKFDLVAHCPTLLQQRIEKKSDIRLTVIDGEFHAVDLTKKDLWGEQICDIRRDNMQDVKYQRVDTPSEIQECVRNMMTSWKLRFSAIDFAINENNDWIFLENNPNGQWAWLDLCSGQNIVESLINSFLHESNF